MKGPGREPVFIISVAARLLEMHPQTLRKYEREGLIAPSRTVGKFRLYSDEDLERLRQVKHLVGERGLNLAGVQLAMEATARLRAMRQRVREADGAESVEAERERLLRELDGLLTLLGAGEPR
jgi:MerR family transcriptional regulator/heat shock protein HspR